jgi:soluble lytic murein transglycosylase
VTVRFAVWVAAATIVAAGCGDPSPTPSAEQRRLTLLARAFSVRTSDPIGAADLFAEAGTGPSLERARFAAWYDTLERGAADAARWQRFIDAQPGDRLAGPAALKMADALADEGRNDEAVAVLLAAPEQVRHPADRRLLDLADPATTAEAARRLALDAPRLLRDASRTIERTALAGLSHDDWMRRAAAWRRAGLGSRGAAELRGLRRQDDEETERRLELARCELDAGSSSRALAALPSVSIEDPDVLVVSAEAYRRRGWSRFPDSAARRSFATCLDRARMAASAAAGPTRSRALELMLECGTESGELAAATDAWRALEALGWGDGRRGWLGRRLGVALARSGRPIGRVDGLSSALDSHRRCLGYWSSISAADAGSLERLARVPVADLYARWARRRVGSTPAANRVVVTAPAGVADPPASVQWLLDHAGPAEANAEWQRLLRQRRPTRSEAISAAALADRAGSPNTAIRTLRQAFPELASVAIAEQPADAVESYLPLRWTGSIVAAAAETGLDPWLIAAVARQESTFTATARSPAGARGVLQLLPSTARGHALRLGLGGRPDLNDPTVNIRLGAHELAWLVRRFGEVEPALAAYNAGETRIRRWSRRWSDPELLVESIPIPETYTYVRRVVFLADAYRLVHADAWRTP